MLYVMIIWSFSIFPYISSKFQNTIDHSFFGYPLIQFCHDASKMHFNKQCDGGKQELFHLSCFNKCWWGLHVQISTLPYSSRVFALYASPVMFRAEKVTFLQFIIYAMAVPLISQLALILVQNFTNYVGGLKSDKMK